MENYHVIDLVGEGSFGKVYKGRRRSTGQTTAMKFIMKHGKTARDIRNLRQEIEILRNLKHENIIQMLDTFETNDEFCVVTEFAQGELFEILEDDKRLPEPIVRNIAKQLVRALHYLHHNRIIHRDMKPQNILVGSGGAVKLCDFGFARAMSCQTMVLTSIKGTPLYMAPELVQERTYTRTVDLWSLGVILYELYCGQPPFFTSNLVSLVNLIVSDPVRYPSSLSPEFKDFLQGLLNKKPENRLDWPDLLSHPFVKESEEERLVREQRLVYAASRAEHSLAWKGEGGAIAGAAVYSGSRGSTPLRDPSTPCPALTHTPVLQQRQTNFEQANVTPPLAIQQHTARTPPAHTPGLASSAAGDAGAVDHTGTATSDVSSISEEDAARLVGKASQKIQDRASAEAVDSDGVTVPLLLHLLRSPNSGEACARWAPSDILRNASTVAGKLLGHNPWSERSVELQRALTKVANTTVMLQPPVIDTAIHLLEVLKESEEVAAAAPVEEHGEFVAFDDTYVMYAYLVGFHMSGADEGTVFRMWAAAASALAAVLRRLQMCLFGGGNEIAARHADSILNQIQQELPASLCRMLQPLADKPSGDVGVFHKQAVAAALQCMKHSVHCEQSANVRSTLDQHFPLGRTLSQLHASPAGLCPAMDWSTHTFVQRRLLAQKLLERTHAAKALMEALDGPIANRDAALVVLLHCCKLNSTLSQACIKGGLIRRLFNLANTPDMAPVAKGRCFRAVAWLVEHARETLTMSERGRNFVQLTTAPQFLVDSLGANSHEPLVAIAALSALSSYCALITSGNLDPAPTLPHVCYSPQTLTTAAELTLTRSEGSPLLETLEGLPCRAGLLDAPFQFLAALLPSPVLDGKATAPSLPNTPAIMNSPLVAAFLSVLSGSDTGLQDLSPNGALRIPQILGRMVSTSAGAAVLTEQAHVSRLVGLLAPQHVSALLVWPINSGGNRKGVTDLVNAVCWALNHAFIVSEQSGRDPSRRALEAKLMGLLQEQDLPKLLISAMEHVNAADSAQPMSIMFRQILVENAAQSHHFVKQYIAAGGMQATFLQKMLRESNPEQVLIKTLLIVSQLARIARTGNEAMSGNYELIHRADIYGHLRKLFSHPDPGVRMRLCSLIGNLCRHSAYFYRHLDTHDIITPIIERCRDPDSHTRKFACFAFGNAAFHNDSLYRKLAPGIPSLVASLYDQEIKTRVNAAGALGNLARNGDGLLRDMIHANAVKVC
eukprot:jgi/Ulvmu1/5292/UM022_0086.1